MAYSVFFGGIVAKLLAHSLYCDLMFRWWTLEEAFQDIRQLSDIPVKRKETDDSESEEDEALWCTYCIDDPAITLCCFCGCRVGL